MTKIGQTAFPPYWGSFESFRRLLQISPRASRGRTRAENKNKGEMFKGKPRAEKEPTAERRSCRRSGNEIPPGDAHSNRGTTGVETFRMKPGSSQCAAGETTRSERNRIASATEPSLLIPSRASRGRPNAGAAGRASTWPLGAYEGPAGQWAKLRPRDLFRRKVGEADGKPGSQAPPNRPC